MNLIKRITSIAMIPITTMLISSCSREDNGYVNSYYADYYNELFEEDKNYNINDLTVVNEGIPLNLNGNSLIILMSYMNNATSSEYKWSFGYITYTDSGEVYFYDAITNKKICLTNYDNNVYKFGFIDVTALNLGYDSYIPTEVAKHIINTIYIELIDPPLAAHIENPSQNINLIAEIHILDLNVLGNLNDYTKVVHTRKLK